MMHDAVWRLRLLHGAASILRHLYHVNLQATLDHREGRPVLSICGTSVVGTRDSSTYTRTPASGQFHFLFETAMMTLEIKLQGSGLRVALRLDFVWFLANLSYVRR